MDKETWRAAWSRYRAGERAAAQREYVLTRLASLLRYRCDEVFRGGIMCPFRRLAAVKSLGHYKSLTKIELP